MQWYDEQNKRLWSNPTMTKAVIKPGVTVRLVTPDNATFHGAVAVVKEVTAWGAHTTTLAGGGRFRALFSEMEPAGPELSMSGVSDPLTVSDETPTGLSYKPVSVAFKKSPAPATDTFPPATATKNGKRQYTGYCCPNLDCQGMNMVQSGTCMLCLDCGTTSGCS